MRPSSGSVPTLRMTKSADASRWAREACAATRLYFLEVVKARAITALCKNGSERERKLGRLDADVETINSTIAARCS